MGLFTGIEGAAGWQAVAGAVTVGVLAVGGLGLYAVHEWSDFKQGLIEQGKAECLSTARSAAVAQITSDFQQSLSELAQANHRDLILAAERSADKKVATDQHAAIVAAMPTGGCTLPDAAVDAVNAPIRGIK